VQQHPAASPGPGVSPRLRVLALALLTMYLLCVTWSALRPLEVLWVAPANVEPFATVRADAARGPEEAARTIGAGMIRLAPLGILLPLLGRHLGGPRFASLFRAVFAGGMIALGLEFCQSLVPSRVADVDSIILNTLGIALTHQLAYRRLRATTRGEPRPAARRTLLRHGAPCRATADGQVRQARRTRVGSWAAPAPADQPSHALSTRA
jgi:hypothetical protein